jgi:hypothetical protein
VDWLAGCAAGALAGVLPALDPLDCAATTAANPSTDAAKTAILNPV